MIAFDAGGEEAALHIAQALGVQEAVDAAVVAAEFARGLFRVVGEGVAKDDLVLRREADGHVEDGAELGGFGVFAVVRIVREDDGRTGALAEVALQFLLRLVLVGEAERADDAEAAEGAATDGGPIHIGPGGLHGGGFPVVRKGLAEALQLLLGELAGDEAGGVGNGGRDALGAGSEAEVILGAAAGEAEAIGEGGGGVEARLHGHVEHLLDGEFDGLHLDHATGEFGGEIGGIGLDDADVFDHAGGEHVERDDAFFGLGGGDHGAVELGGAVAFAEAADVDEAAADDADAGYFLQRTGRVGRRAAGEFFAAHAVADGGGELAFVEHCFRGCFDGADAFDDVDFGDVGGVGKQGAEFGGGACLDGDIGDVDGLVVGGAEAEGVGAGRSGDGESTIAAGDVAVIGSAVDGDGYTGDGAATLAIEDAAGDCSRFRRLTPRREAYCQEKNEFTEQTGLPRSNPRHP